MRLPELVDTPLRTIAALTLLPAGIVLLSLLAILIALLGGSDEQVHRAYRAFARMCLWVGGTDLQVHGRDHLREGQAYVIVPNHESNWDPPSLIEALTGVVLRFIVKQQISSIPIFGHALRLTGNVTVQRNRSGRDAASIREGMQQRQGKVSMLFFAEGTRSRSGRLGSFKKGAFATAITHSLPVLPIAIAGSHWVWPPGFVRIRRGRVVLEIGEPIPVAGLTLEDRGRLSDQTREQIIKLRTRAYARLRDSGQPMPEDG